MKTTHSILLSMILVPGIAYAVENSDHSRITGRYTGMVYNGRDMDPVVTTFYVQPDGRLRGNYSAEDETGLVEGTISNAINVEGRTFTFEWTDKYGEGQAIMVFSIDFSSFNGYWTNYSDTEQFEWSGSKE